MPKIDNANTLMLMHVKISDLPLNTNHSCGQADGSVATVVLRYLVKKLNIQLI